MPSADNTVPPVTPATLDRAIAGFPRRDFALLPTPLEELPRLSRALGGPRILAKRDDMTGHALGGNKARKLSYILADAESRGADTIVTWAAVQSNWVRMTAAGARRLGMRPVAVLHPRIVQASDPADGNLLLDRILGADVRIIDPEGDCVAEAGQVVEEIRAKGGKPYVVPVGGSGVSGSMETPLGAISYVAAFRELLAQTEERSGRPTHVVHASGSGSTQAGLVVGARALAPDVRILGIGTGRRKVEAEANILKIARQAAAALELDLEVRPEHVEVNEDYIGRGYGHLNRSVVEAIATMARTEGIFLDPVYSGKGMSGLIDLIRRGAFRPDDTVVFVHTGGTPALFPYKEEILRDLPPDRF